MSSACLDTSPIGAVRLAAGRSVHRTACRAAWLAASLITTATVAAPPLRVCADPDNLPYSHADGRGFETRIAQVVADELQRPLAITWLRMHRGFVRKTLGEGRCDVLLGVPVGLPRVVITQPYYRSTYVFVTRTADPQPLRDFADPRLAALRVGVQLVGNDLAATPPGHALARHGAVDRVVGYAVDGDGPAAARMLQSLARGELDAALVWGPQAGYFAQRLGVPLALTAARAPSDVPVPFEFGIAMAVRHGDEALRDALDGALVRRRAEIDTILAAHAVPRTDRTAP